MPGTFAATPESLGMYYQWGRKVGLSVTEPKTNSDGGTTWNDSEYEGDEWLPENDPCPNGWRMPIIEDLDKLRDTENVTREAIGVPKTQMNTECPVLK
jgi:hypothetical protein